MGSSTSRALMLVLALLAGGCQSLVGSESAETVADASEERGDETDSEPDDPGTTEPPAEEEEEAPVPAPAPGPITVALAGDVHVEGVVASLVAAGGDPLEVVAPIFHEADISVLNLETAVGEAGTAQDKQYTFLAPPTFWPILRGADVDVVSLANNHALDFGAGLVPQMLADARTNEVTTVGAGSSAQEAYAPAIFEVRGRRVAVVGLTRVIPYVEWAATETRPGLASAYDEQLAVAAVRRAAEQADHVVVAIHWGEESMDCPVDHQVRLAELLVDAGADVVAGHHPHVLQGVVEREEALVAYSLGNFVWYSARPPGALTGVLVVTLETEGVADWEFVPAVIDHNGAPQPVTGAPAQPVLDRLEMVSRPDCAP